MSYTAGNWNLWTDYETERAQDIILNRTNLQRSKSQHNRLCKAPGPTYSYWSSSGALHNCTRRNGSLRGTRDHNASLEVERRH